MTAPLPCVSERADYMIKETKPGYFYLFIAGYRSRCYKERRFLFFTRDKYRTEKFWYVVRDFTAVKITGACAPAKMFSGYAEVLKEIERLKGRTAEYPKEYFYR